MKKNEVILRPYYYASVSGGEGQFVYVRIYS